MSLQRFENESSGEEKEEEKENRRGSAFASLGAIISDAKRGSIFDGKRGSIFHNEGKRGSIFQLESKRGSLFPAADYLENTQQGRGSIFHNEGKRGSMFQLEGKRGSLFPPSDYLENTQQGRGSIFQLFDDPYRGEEPMAVRFEEYRKQSRGTNKTVTFKELTRTETQLLRKRLLYKGEYRVLNSSVLFILGLIIFGIVFMSAWHYNNQNFWVLYLVLGLILGAVGLNVMAIKLYFHYKRYHGSGSSSRKGVKDLIIENFGFKEDSGETVGTKAIDIVLTEVQKHEV